MVAGREDLPLHGRILREALRRLVDGPKPCGVDSPGRAARDAIEEIRRGRHVLRHRGEGFPQDASGGRAGAEGGELLLRRQLREAGFVRRLHERLREERLHVRLAEGDGELGGGEGRPAHVRVHRCHADREFPFARVDCLLDVAARQEPLQFHREIRRLVQRHEKQQRHALVHLVRADFVGAFEECRDLRLRACVQFADFLEDLRHRRLGGEGVRQRLDVDFPGKRLGLG